MYLAKIKEAQRKRPVNQEEIYKRISIAIDRIAEAYDPAMQFTGTSLFKRMEIERMVLEDMNSIAIWEQSWLSLIAEMKRKKHLK